VSSAPASDLFEHLDVYILTSKHHIVSITVMRTTLTLDDDVAARLTAAAKDRHSRPS
jgi:hypothetical protein